MTVAVSLVDNKSIIKNVIIALRSLKTLQGGQNDILHITTWFAYQVHCNSITERVKLVHNLNNSFWCLPPETCPRDDRANFI